MTYSSEEHTISTAPTPFTVSITSTQYIGIGIVHIFSGG